MRFAVLHLEDSPRWPAGASLADNWVMSLREPGETWDVYETAKECALPSLDSVPLYAGLVLSGSHYNLSEPSTASLPWVLATVEFLQRLEALRRAPAGPGPVGSHVAPLRVVGGCFGAQLLAHAFGGVVTRNPCRSFHLKAELLAPTAKFSASPRCAGVLPDDATNEAFSDDSSPHWSPRPCLTVQHAARCATAAAPEPLSTSRAAAATGCSSGTPSASDGAPSTSFGCAPSAPSRGLRILKSHGDCVSVLPPGAELLASSRSCAHEVWSLRGTFLAVQSHPEFALSCCVLDKIMPAVVARGSLTPEQAAVSLASFQLPRHHGRLLVLIARWLRGADMS